MKKLIIAIVVAYVFLMATNYVIHSVWLMPDYDAIPLSHRNAEQIMQRFWAMALGQFFFAAMFAYRARTREQAVDAAGNSLRNRDDIHDCYPVFVERVRSMLRPAHAGGKVDGRGRNSTRHPRFDSGGNLQRWPDNASRVKHVSHAPSWGGVDFHRWERNSQPGVQKIPEK